MRACGGAQDRCLRVLYDVFRLELSSPMRRFRLLQQQRWPCRWQSSEAGASGAVPYRHPQQQQRLDVVVLGCGLSGQRCATLLAQANLRVAVVAPLLAGAGELLLSSMREAILYLSGKRQHAFYGSEYSRTVRGSSHLTRQHISDRVESVSQWHAENALANLRSSGVQLLRGLASFAHVGSGAGEPSRILVEGDISGNFRHVSAASQAVFSSLQTSEDAIVVPNRSKRSLTLTCDYVVIATGSRSFVDPTIPFDGRHILTSDELVSNRSWHLPRHATVASTRPQGLEHASILSQLPDTEVTFVEQSENLLSSVLDRELEKQFRVELQRGGVEMLTEELVDARVSGKAGLDVSDKRVLVSLKSGRSFRTDLLVCDTGRVSNTDSLGLGLATDLETDKNGFVLVDDDMKSGAGNIYAIGPCARSEKLGYRCLSDAMLAARSICRRFKSCDYAAISSAGSYDASKQALLLLHTSPLLSSVGATQQQLDAEHRPYVEGVASHFELAKAQMRGRQRGFLKLLVDAKTRRVLGVHILGEQADELVHIGQALMAHNGTIDYFFETVFNYPAYAEAFRVAAFDAHFKLLKTRSTSPSL